MNSNKNQETSCVIKKIVVVGLGYIGLPTAAMFASRKIEVVGVDINPVVVERINNGEIHIAEPDLDIVVRAAVSQNYLRASSEPEQAQAFMVAVPTPFVGDNHKPDLSFVEAACSSIAPRLEPGNLVILESTCPVGTTDQMIEWMRNARPDLTFPDTDGEKSDIRVAHCPERVLPGKIMQELIINDRLIGGVTARCAALAEGLYKTFVTGDCITTSARTAEMAKLTENSFRDTNIAFANELSMICDRLKIDVWEVINLANRHPRVNILRPGPGVGGHCIAVDPWFIIASAPEDSQIIRTARKVNDSKPDWIIEKVELAIENFLAQYPKLDREDTTICCYGLAFKPDIDDLRESPALEIARRLLQRHEGALLVVEPNIESLPGSICEAEHVSIETAFQRADIHVYLVAHREFKQLAKPPRFVIDAVGI